MVKMVRESAVPFAALAVLFIFLSWRIIRPMVTQLLWSGMLSCFAYPLYTCLRDKLFRGRHNNIAAGLTTTVILVFMAIPMIIFALFLTKEGLRIFTALTDSGFLSSSYADMIQEINGIPIVGRITDWLDLTRGIPVLDIIFNGAVSWFTRFVSRLSSEILGNAFQVFYLLMVVAISSFFIVRDGGVLVSYIKDVLPLSESGKEDIVKRTSRMLRAVVYGIAFTASLQGALGGLGWHYCGLPNAIFFGFLMFICGMIPFVGTPVIWIPGSIFLLANGQTMSGILLLIWGFGVVSTIDNFIRPIFIAEGSNIHILVIFIGIIGGAFNWGFLGIFLGPLVLSLALFVLDVYRKIVAERKIFEPGDE